MRLALAAPSLWVVGLSLSTAAYAAEESEVLDAVRARLDEVGSQQLVVCAAGEDTEKAARQLVDTLDDEVRISRIPILGDIESETERVRVQQAVTCAIWLRRNADTWEVGTVGPCTPPDTTNAIGPVVASLPVDPTDGDPIESSEPPPSEPTGERSPAPPASTSAPATVVLPPKLTVTDLARNTEEHDAVRWHVVDARGVAWSAPRFAETMGDTETLERLDRDLQSARVERKVLFWAGIAGLALSPVPLAFTESGAYGRNADLAWTSLFLASTGGFTLALHKVGERSEKTRQLRPALYYSRADSDALVAAYNAKIDARQSELDNETAPAPSPAIPPNPQADNPANDQQAAAETGSGAAPTESAPAPAAADEAGSTPPAPLESPVPAETPDTEATETEAPETEAPAAEASPTEAPDAEVPAPEAPETEAPETEAPETEAPETEVPETEVPETEVPPVEPPPEADVSLPASTAEPPSEAPNAATEPTGTESAGGAQ